MRRITLAAALVLSLAAVPAKSQEGGLAQLLENADRIMRALEILEAVEKSILLTEQECEALGQGWENYRRMGGRFPIGAGTGRDENSEERTFGFEPEPSRRGGTYRHTLTAQEMPKHQHGYIDKYLNNEKAENANRGDDDDRERLYNMDKRRTTFTGGSMPHNNMPPYLVLNFCRWSND